MLCAGIYAHAYTPSYPFLGSSDFYIQKKIYMCYIQTYATINDQYKHKAKETNSYLSDI